MVRPQKQDGVFPFPGEAETHVSQLVFQKSWHLSAQTGGESWVHTEAGMATSDVHAKVAHQDHKEMGPGAGSKASQPLAGGSLKLPYQEVSGTPSLTGSFRFCPSLTPE